MDEYEFKILRNGEEIEAEEIPSEYLCGLIELFKNEFISRSRWERMCKRIPNNKN